MLYAQPSLFVVSMSSSPFFPTGFFWVRFFIFQLVRDNLHLHYWREGGKKKAEGTKAGSRPLTCHSKTPSQTDPAPMH